MKKENKRIIILLVIAGILFTVFYQKEKLPYLGFSIVDYANSPTIHNTILIMLVLLSLMILKVIIKSFVNFLKYKPKRSGYKRKLSELFSQDYFKCKNWNNVDNADMLQRINKFLVLYSSIVRISKDTRGTTYEDFLLHRFGQIIFIHNRGDDKLRSNTVDYKIVDKGLNDLFPLNNYEHVDLETVNKRENFIKKFAGFVAQWVNLQIQYTNHIYSISEWATLISVLKEKNENEMNEVLLQINNICDSYERVNCNVYRELFLTVANKIYHEKDVSKQNLMNVIQKDLIDVLSEKRYVFCKLVSKIDKIFVSFIPFIIFLYSLGFMIYNSPAGILLNQLLIAFPIAIFSTLLERLIRTMQGKFYTLNEYENIAKNERILRQQKKDALKSRSTSGLNEERHSTSAGSQNVESKNNIQYVCKYCGMESSSAYRLTHTRCENRNPTGMHELYGGTKKAIYYCQYCGIDEEDIWKLTHNSIKCKSPNGRHIPYEGEEKTKYCCKFCGVEKSSIYKLTHESTCKINPTRNHIPL